jgi:hypothetical protein
MRATLCLALLAAIAAASCAPTVDLTAGLQVLDSSTGWRNAGPVDGQNKIVPTITFTLKNVSGETLKSLQVNAVFRRSTDPPEEWGSGYMTVVKSEGLAPGAATPPITLESPKGYTSADSPVEMLHNKAFIDGNVDLLAKYSSGQWQSIAKLTVAREIITR